MNATYTITSIFKRRVVFSFKPEVKITDLSVHNLDQNATKISFFDMWFNIVKPRFLFKTVDLWSYINT